MRRLPLLLLAGLLALGFAVPQQVAHAKPVHAIGACGIPTDFDRVPYNDGYWQNFQTVQDTTTGATHDVGFDLAAYRVSDNGHCLRSYYTSTWVNDRTVATDLTAHLRVWICGQPAADFQQVAYNDWGRAVVAYHQNQVWGPPWGTETYAVNTPDGHTWLLDFADYASCGRQADNLITSAHSVYWNPNTAFVYENING